MTALSTKNISREYMSGDNAGKYRQTTNEKAKQVPMEVTQADLAQPRFGQSMILPKPMVLRLSCHAVIHGVTNANHNPKKPSLQL